MEATHLETRVSQPPGLTHDAAWTLWISTVRNILGSIALGDARDTTIMERVLNGRRLDGRLAASSLRSGVRSRQ